MNIKGFIFQLKDATVVNFNYNERMTGRNNRISMFPILDNVGFLEPNGIIEMNLSSITSLVKNGRFRFHSFQFTGIG